MKRVLITGMSGLIGGLLRAHLEERGGYELAALNRRPVEGVECFQADISDLDAIVPAFEGRDVVVHLAAHLGDEPLDSLVAANIVGVRNVYEAARLAGVRRVVFASSGATIKSWEDYPPYDAIRDGRHEELANGWPMVTKEMIRPRGLYGASKVWGEAVGRHYADAFGLSVICIRIGSVGDRDHPNTAKPSATYLSHRDVADILRRAIDAPDSLEYEIVYATSNNRYGYRDLEGAREVLGFVPQDTDEAAFE